MNIEGFEDIVRWPIGDNVRHDVIEKMNFRARVEEEEFLHNSHTGGNFKKVHKESISRGERYKDIVDSIIQILDIPTGSICADLGAGTGTFAALISHQPRVQRIYTVEISEQFTTRVMPITFEYFQANREKIVRIIGDFNRLEFDDNSLDFTVETGSFHHSEDISKTLSECHRVLKPGGFLLANERARSNIISASKKKWMLDRELDSEMKRKYGIPVEESYTRGMWGEHEFTFEEWNRHFKAAGFLTTMAVIKPLAMLQPFRFLLNRLCSVGPLSFEPFYLRQGRCFLRHPYIYYELLSKPIFICFKPPRSKM